MPESSSVRCGSTWTATGATPATTSCAGTSRDTSSRPGLMGAWFSAGPCTTPTPAPPSRSSADQRPRRQSRSITLSPSPTPGRRAPSSGRPSSAPPSRTTPSTCWPSTVRPTGARATATRRRGCRPPRHTGARIPHNRWPSRSPTGCGSPPPNTPRWQAARRLPHPAAAGLRGVRPRRWGRGGRGAGPPVGPLAGSGHVELAARGHRPPAGSAHGPDHPARGAAPPSWMTRLPGIRELRGERGLTL